MKIMADFDRDALVAEVKRLRAGIRAHRDSSEQDLCWHHLQPGGSYPRRATRFRTFRHGPSSCAAACAIVNHSTHSCRRLREHRLSSKAGGTSTVCRLRRRAEQTNQLRHVLHPLEAMNDAQALLDALRRQLRVGHERAYLASTSLHAMPRGADPRGASTVLVNLAPDLVTTVTVPPQLHL